MAPKYWELGITTIEGESDGLVPDPQPGDIAENLTYFPVFYYGRRIVADFVNAIRSAQTREEFNRITFDISASENFRDLSKERREWVWDECRKKRDSFDESSS